jgi:tetratricopeptide (TPR) repeat protein
MTPDEELDETFELAKAANAADRPAAAAEYLSVYLRHRPGHAYAWFLLGDSLRRIGLRHEAERALLSAWELQDADGGNQAWHVAARLGTLHNDWGDYDGSEVWYARAVERLPGDRGGWVWIMRGANLARAGQFRAAEEAHRRALAHPDADRDEAYLNLALLARAQGRYDEAVALLNEALKVTPDYPEVIEELAMLEGVQEAAAHAARLRDRLG